MDISDNFPIFSFGYGGGEYFPIICYILTLGYFVVVIADLKVISTLNES
jgi:hypothetical protein